MRLSFITLFPELCTQAMQTGVLGRGVEKGLIEIESVNFRDFTDDAYQSVDDTPYGGGPGMLLKVEPIVRAVESLDKKPRAKVILLKPSGATFNQAKARELSSLDQLIFICGRYEGIDERVAECLDDVEEISIGDYVLTGGELGALTIADAVCRLKAGVLGDEKSTEDESFSEDYVGLEYPQYTRPREFRGKTVPEVLMNGNHQAIREWKESESLRITRDLRPDLLSNRAS